MYRTIQYNSYYMHLYIEQFMSTYNTYLRYRTFYIRYRRYQLWRRVLWSNQTKIQFTFIVKSKNEY